MALPSTAGLSTCGGPLFRVSGSVQLKTCTTTKLHIIQQFPRLASIDGLCGVSSLVEVPTGLAYKGNRVDVIAHVAKIFAVIGAGGIFRLSVRGIPRLLPHLDLTSWLLQT